jgi:hypothetical protein
MVQRLCFHLLQQLAVVLAAMAVIMVLLVALAAAVVRVGQATRQVVQEHQDKVLLVVRVVPIT